jgi:hypothetical protein
MWKRWELPGIDNNRRYGGRIAPLPHIETMGKKGKKQIQTSFIESLDRGEERPIIGDALEK